MKPSPRRDPAEAPSRATSPAALEALFLSSIVTAHADVGVTVDAAFSRMSPRGPDLVTLRNDLRRRLDRLLEELLALSDEQGAIDALVPFVFFVDEQVEHCLALTTEPGGESWSQLQRDLLPERRAEGGDVFYERAGELLSEAEPRATVVAAYLFCLKAGFRGRLADEPEDVASRWIRLLAERLPSGKPRGDVPPSTWRTPQRTAAYLTVAVATVVTWHLFVSLWAYLQ